MVLGCKSSRERTICYARDTSGSIDGECHRECRQHHWWRRAGLIMHRSRESVQRAGTDVRWRSAGRRHPAGVERLRSGQGRRVLLLRGASHRACRKRFASCRVGPVESRPQGKSGRGSVFPRPPPPLVTVTARVPDHRASRICGQAGALSGGQRAAPRERLGNATLVPDGAHERFRVRNPWNRSVAVPPRGRRNLLSATGRT
jgi:hypothetical protein